MQKAGRPSKYESKYCQELIDFFDIEPFTDIDIPHMGATGEFKWMDYKRMANKLPTVRNFCKKISIHYDTFYEWIKRHKEFSDTFTRAQEIRKWFLIENGLNGCYNPSFAIFVAKNITDMTDEQTTRLTGEIGQNVNINITTYGKDDPLFTYLSSELRSNQFKPASPNGNAGSAPVSSPQLAQKSKEDDIGDKPID